jgi:hypothetical protein
MNQSDIDIRIVNEGRVPLAPLVRVQELREGGAVMADDTVKVTAMLVDLHGSCATSPTASTVASATRTQLIYSTPFTSGVVTTYDDALSTLR